MLHVRAWLLLAAIAVGPVAAQGPDEKSPAKDEPLPANAVARFGSTRLLQGEGIGALHFSPDGRTLASQGRFGSAVYFWDVASGIKSHTLDTGSSISEMAYHPSGKILATGHFDHKIRLWDTTTWKLLRNLDKHKGGVRALAFSLDGTILASDGDDSGGERGPKERFLVKNGNKKDRLVRLWDVASGKHLGELVGHEDAVSSLAFSSDSLRLYSSGDDDSIIAWDVAARKQLKRVTKKGATGLWVSADGKTLHGWIGADRKGRFGVKDSGFALGAWKTSDLSDAETRVKIEGGLGISAVAADSKAFAFTDKSGISILDDADGRELARFAEIGNPRQFALSSGAKYLASASGTRIRIWEISTRKDLHPSDGHHSEVALVRYLPGDSRLVSIDQSGSVLTREAKSGRVLSQFCVDAETLQLQGARFSPNVKILAVPKWSKGLELWEVESGKNIASIELAKPAGKLSFSGGGEVLAYGDSVTIYASRHKASSTHWFGLIDVLTGKEIHDFGFQEGDLSSVSFSPDGKHLLKCGKEPELWDLKTKKKISSFKAARGDWEYYAGGPLLFSHTWSFGFHELHFMEPTEGIAKHRMAFVDNDGESFRSLRSGDFRISPDGKILALASTLSRDHVSHIQLRAIPSGRYLGSLPAHAGWTNCLDFSSDGKHLATGGEDGCVMIWDVSAAIKSHLGKKATLSAADMQNAWQDLGGEEGSKSVLAVDALAADSQTVEFLKKAVSPIPEEGTLELLAELGHESFARRAKAMQELERREYAAQAAIAAFRKEKPPSLEVERRLEILMRKFEEPMTLPEVQRTWRAVTVLEQIGTAEARQLLESLAHGAPQARLTKDAKGALERMAKWP